MSIAADDGAVAAMAAKHAAAATYSAVGTASVIGWINSLDWVAVSGVCIGVATFGVNWYYKRRRDAREEAHEELEEELKRARIAALQRRLELDLPTADEVALQDRLSEGDDVVHEHVAHRDDDNDPIELT